MASTKMKSRSSITISAENSLSTREIALANHSLVEVLNKHSSAELGAYIVPQGNDDVFRRRIVVSRVNKRADIGLDIPDLDDVQYTDLPWIGHASFRTAHRAFRSKFCLAVVVEVIREIDGYLYNLTIDVPNRVLEPLPLKIVEVPNKNKLTGGYDLTIRKDLDEETLAKHFTNVPDVPETLIKYMKALGYILTDGVFSHPEVQGYAARIRCEVWGKLNRINSHLREIK